MGVSRGKRASRQRGEQTRQDILQATLRVLARDGVRGVTHRSIAAEAGVNLSLTTYYFSDLGEIVASAFELYVDRDQSLLLNKWQRAFRYLQRLGSPSQLDKATRNKMFDYVLTRMVGHILEQLEHDRVGLAVERHFFFEALNDPRLIELAADHRRRLCEPMEQLCRLMGSDQPALDADLLLGTILRLEYEALAQASNQIDVRHIRAAIARMLVWILRLNLQDSA